jgi:AP2 domain
MTLTASRLRSNNTTGVKGVSERRGRFRAQIMVHRKQKHLGYFRTAELAAAAYIAANSNRRRKTAKAA